MADSGAIGLQEGVGDEGLDIGASGVSRAEMLEATVADMRGWRCLAA